MKVKVRVNVYLYSASYGTRSHETFCLKLLGVRLDILKLFFTKLVSTARNIL